MQARSMDMWLVTTKDAMQYDGVDVKYEFEQMAQRLKYSGIPIVVNKNKFGKAMTIPKHSGLGTKARPVGSYATRSFRNVSELRADASAT